MRTTKVFLELLFFSNTALKYRVVDTIYSSIEIWEDEKTCRYITSIENDNGDVSDNLVATIQNDIDVLYQFDTQLRELIQNENELMEIWEQANLETPVYNC